MSTSRPFAYNTGAPIPGTEQVGNLAIGWPTAGFESTGLEWWNGPDEELGYIIAKQVPADNQPTPVPDTASVAFSRSTALTQGSFILLANSIGNQVFANGSAAKTWLNNNGYWTSWEDVLPIFSLDAGDANSYPGSGTTWTDTVGGLDFTLINGPTYSSSYGGNIFFLAGGGIGQSDYAECSTSLPSLSTYTISVWHKQYNGLGALPAIITEIQSGSGPINYKLGKITPSGPLLQAGYYSNGSWRNTTVPPDSPAYVEVWSHILMTVDSQQNLKLYLNNILVESVTFTGETPSSSGQGIRLMKNHGTAEEVWGGYLAKVDIYDKALNSVEISDIWDLNRNRFGI
jgi:hypothetical protein